MNEWGVPDWRDATAYGETESWHLGQWYWEFLRRRADLRYDFDSKKDANFATKTALWKWDNSVSPDGVSTPDEPGFNITTILINPSEIDDMDSLPNPRISKHPSWAMPRLRNRQLQQINKGRLKFEDRYYRVDFDLDRPIRPQLEEAEKALKSFQKHRHGKLIQKRHHTEKWLTYLRVLDARDARASWAEVSEILTYSAATEQNARDIHKQALALCFNF